MESMQWLTLVIFAVTILVVVSNKIDSTLAGLIGVVVMIWAGVMTEDEFEDVDWVRESDVVVAEVTTVSLGVGYEIGFAEQIGKRVICLYRPQAERRLSAMILGNTKLTVVEYQSIEDLDKKFKELLA